VFEEVSKELQKTGNDRFKIVKEAGNKHGLK